MNLCIVFGHKYQTTHVNKWMIPTRRGCTRCKHAQVTTGLTAGMKHYADMNHPERWQAEAEND
jgi:hypothetical protein